MRSVLGFMTPVTVVPNDPMEALMRVSTVTEMDRYLHRHLRISFATHVISIQYLFNRVIAASNAYYGDTGSNKNNLVL